MGSWRHVPCWPPWSEPGIPINPIITGNTGGSLCHLCYVVFHDEATSARNPRLNNEGTVCTNVHMHPAGV